MRSFPSLLGLKQPIGLGMEELDQYRVGLTGPLAAEAERLRS